MNKIVNNVVILGGGTAGWMTAAALSKVLSNVKVTLVESEQIGTIGVGEATIPTMQFFNGLLDLDSHTFLKHTRGTYKLGIQFENWAAQEHSYFHAFGSTGRSLWAAGFHDFWRKGLELGISDNFSAYNIEAVAAGANRFAQSKNGLNYAFHLDSSLYAKLLRSVAEKQGVTRIEGKVAKVNCEAGTGFISSLLLESGEHVAGDLFVDCSGFKGLLINETLKVPFNDYGQWLKCDRAWAVQTKTSNTPVPYTRSIAHDSGWQWRIPLQHRMGNGIVYSSQYMDDDTARERLLSTVEGEPITEPRLIGFKTGHREQLWHKNCVAIGLSGGFIEPLESTAIHLIQQGILRLIKLFPSQGIEQLDIDEFNKSGMSDYQQIRDFIVLHYCQTQRDDSDFWRYCKQMEIPESLQERMSLFRKTGRFIVRHEEIFVDSWLQVMIGQGLIPEKYHRIADEMQAHELKAFLDNIVNSHHRQVSALPEHQQYLTRYCQ